MWKKRENSYENEVLKAVVHSKETVIQIQQGWHNFELETASTHKFRADKILAWEKRSRQCTPLLTKKTSATDSF